jgi:iron(II)-dependent oxidoreductase
MEPKIPDPGKRTLFDLFHDPERLGRELGRAYRQLHEIFYPPTISPEEHAAELNRIEMLEAQVKTLSEQHTQDQEANRQLLLQVVEQDKKLSEIIDILKKSSLPQDKEQLTRWQQLRKRLWVVVVALFGVEGLLGPKGIAEAIRDVWAQETFWPVIKALPSEVQEAWQKLVETTPDQPASPLPAPGSPLDSPLPTATPDQQSSSLFIDPYAPEMVLIPAGEFLMGSDKRVDSRTHRDEMPQRRVYLSAYKISRYPITNGQYKVFLDATGYIAPYHWQDGKIPLAKINHPVVYVNWDDAQRYCEWLSKIRDHTYRLPTEAEWEKAARGTDGRIYPWGNQTPDAKLLNYYAEALRKDITMDTVPVDSYPPGVNGLYDIIGNIWEWTADWYLYDYYTNSPASNPKGPESGLHRVLRGSGSITDFVQTYRGYSHPPFKVEDYYFRCARRNVSEGRGTHHVGFRVASDDS